MDQDGPMGSIGYSPLGLILGQQTAFMFSTGAKIYRANQVTLSLPSLWLQSLTMHPVVVYT